jgi:CheY-like chemotaxis protein
MAEGYPAAAAEAARYLGASGDPYLLHANTPQPSALVKALQHPDRRLRFAALAAIMALDPERTYPGAGRVTEALEYFARSSGAPKALIVASHNDEATRLAGLAAGLGYEPEVTTDGAAAARLAQLLGDFEFALVDMAVGGATSGQFLQRLRVDPRSAELPVLVLALADEVAAADRLARLSAPAVAIVRPHTVEALDTELKVLARANNRGVVSREERTAECAQALRWIGQQADRPRTLYELRRLDAAVLASLETPEVTEIGLATLARLDTVRSQLALAEVASRQSAPIEIRRAAANAFGESVVRVGTLLTTDQIMKQYDRYNASATADSDTQKVLASILDTIEARAAGEALAAGREAPKTSTEP